MDEVISANYRPADNNIDAAVDYHRADGEEGFGFVCNFVNKR